MRNSAQGPAFPISDFGFSAHPPRHNHRGTKNKEKSFNFTGEARIQKHCQRELENPHPSEARRAPRATGFRGREGGGWGRAEEAYGEPEARRAATCPGGAEGEAGSRTADEIDVTDESSLSEGTEVEDARPRARPAAGGPRNTKGPWQV